MDRKMGKSKNKRDLKKNLTLLDEGNLLPPKEISSNNESFSCVTLHNMYKNGKLQIQPEFQRNFVWKPTVQTRFIDSLVKGLPIPSLWIALDYNTEERRVIDGLQRISTIFKFLENGKWKLNRMSDIYQKISGKLVSDIKSNSSNLYEKVENSTIPVITIRCDFSIQSHMDYLFNIFHRLNTGGQKLTNQEVRNGIYGGNFNKLLSEIAKSEEWTKIIGKTPEIDRLDNEELVLRVFAFLDKLEDYTGNLAKFLNHYMSEKQNATDNEIEAKKEVLNTTLSFICENIDNPASVSKLNKTQKEGLLVGVCKNIENITSKSAEEFQEMFEEFINAEEFSPENLKQGLSKKESVQPRLRKAISIFEG